MKEEDSEKEWYVPLSLEFFSYFRPIERKGEKDRGGERKKRDQGKGVRGKRRKRKERKTNR